MIPEEYQTLFVPIEPHRIGSRLLTRQTTRFLRNRSGSIVAAWKRRASLRLQSELVSGYVNDALKPVATGATRLEKSTPIRHSAVGVAPVTDGLCQNLIIPPLANEPRTLRTKSGTLTLLRTPGIRLQKLQRAKGVTGAGLRESLKKQVAAASDRCKGHPAVANKRPTCLRRCSIRSKSRRGERVCACRSA
jgi:hypothetical protein